MQKAAGKKFPARTQIIFNEIAGRNSEREQSHKTAVNVK